ncbi:MAG: DUF2723 domain-containing protein [candidate division WOR-3 bacterium]
MSKPQQQPGQVWLPFSVGSAALVVYALTVAPAVGLIDSGELSAGCYLLNILHPTGYPLYTLLGRLATTIPLGSVVNRMAGMSALLSAVGVGLFVLLCLRLGLSGWSAASAGLVMAFSVPVWSSSTDAEVHSLTLVLGVLVWLATVRTDSRNYLLFFAYLAGLALTNHMSAASLVAGAAIAVVSSARSEVRRRLLVTILLFLLGLSPYLFLLLRARAGPVMAWGNPVNLERLWWHVTGKQYQVWMFSLPVSEILANAGRCAAMLGRSLTWVLIPVSAAGAIVMFRIRRGLAVGLVATAVLAFLYGINYSIPDIEAYFLPVMVTLGLFVACGLELIVQRWRPARPAALLPAAVLLATGWASLSRHGHYVALDAALNTLASADSGAVIVTDWWDLYAPVYYLQHVERVRPDVCVIDRELVRRSWYVGYLESEYPWLFAGLRNEKAEYVSYLNQFEHGRLRDPAAIQRCYIALLRGFLVRDGLRSGYVTFAPDAGPDARQLLAGLPAAPVGLLFRVGGDDALPPFDYTRLAVRVPRCGVDGRTRANLERYRYFVGRRVRALLDAGRPEEAQALAGWAETTLLLSSPASAR